MSYIFKTAPFALASMILISSCNDSTQYGVRVVNATGESLKLEFKADNDIKGTIEETLVIDADDSEIIIWTEDLKNENGRTPDRTKACQFTADYINAYVRESIPSKIAWCDNRFDLQISDIGQREFVVRYELSDFDL